jgi:hypothetical protein
MKELTKAEKEIKEKHPDIFKFYQKHKNELVLNLFDVVRLVGLEMDDWDYYWVFNSRREIFWSSCVGSFIPLKNSMKDKDYRYLDQIFKMNDWTKDIK